MINFVITNTKEVLRHIVFANWPTTNAAGRYDARVRKVAVSTSRGGIQGPQLSTMSGTQQAVDHKGPRLCLQFQNRTFKTFAT